MPEDTRPPHVRLQASIAKLTHPFEVVTKQRQTKGYKVISVTHPPLLTQLQVMSASSVGGKNAVTTGSLVIDADAVEKLAAVEKHITASWVMLIPGSGPLIRDSHLSPEHSLSLWADVFEEHRQLGLVVEPRVIAEAKLWDGWVRLIETKFSPEDKGRFPYPCPKCGTRWVLTSDNRDEQDRVDAVSITWRGVKDSTAFCKFCGEQWVGETRLRQLESMRVMVEKASLEKKLAPEMAM